MKAILVVGLVGYQALASPVATYTWIYKNVFQAKCATSCHQSTDPDGGVDLTTYQGLIDSDGMLWKPIVSGDPENSGVWIQVHRKTMPKSGEKLSDEEIQAIYDWIKDGAKNN